jgi:hypothetical protein
MRVRLIALGLAICALVLSCSPKQETPAPSGGPKAAAAESKTPSLRPPEPSSDPKTAGTEASPLGLPPGLQAQWSRFQAALKADDAKLLAETARFPIRSNEFGGDIASPEVLAQRYATIFPETTRRCLLASTLERLEYDGHVLYQVYCDVGPYPIRFLFEPQGAQYFWTGLDNINE